MSEHVSELAGNDSKKKVRKEERSEGMKEGS